MRIANLYFLLVSCLQMFTPFSPTGRWGTILPLALVMGVTVVKDGLEDIKRHLSDREVNNSKTLVVRNGEEMSLEWKKVK